MLWSLAARAGIPAARSALRFLSRLKKPPKTGGITLYRGEYAAPKSTIKEVADRMYGPAGESIFHDPSPLRHAAVGRWFSSNPYWASRFAGNKVYSWKPKDWKNIINWGGGYERGVVKKLTLSAKEAKLAKKVQRRISEGSRSALPLPTFDDYFVVPRSTLPRVETDALRTAVANLKRMMGLKHGGLAGILEV